MEPNSDLPEIPEIRKPEDYRDQLVQAAAEYLDAGQQTHAEVVESLPAEAKLVIQMEVTADVDPGTAVPIPNKDPDRDP